MKCQGINLYAIQLIFQIYRLKIISFLNCADKIMNNTYSQTNLSINSHSNVSQLMKKLTEGNKEFVQKYLSTSTFSDQDLNKGLFQCIENFQTLSHHSDCLHLLARTKGTNVNCIINGKTPLISACIKGQESLVKVLLDNGAKVDQKDNDNNHPLYYVMKSNKQNSDVAQLIIQKMSSVNNEISKKMFPLMMALEKQFDKIAKKLIDRGANLNFMIEETGDTLLHFVCKKQYKLPENQKKLIKLITSAGKIKVQLKNKQNKMAIDYLNEDLKQILLQLTKSKTKEKQKEKQKEREKQKEKQKQREKEKEKRKSTTLKEEKQDNFELQQELEELQFNEEFQYDSTRKQSKDETNDKKLEEIVEQSDQEKKDDEKQKQKDKNLKARKSFISSSGNINNKQKISKQIKNPPIKTVKPKQKEKTNNNNTNIKFQKKIMKPSKVTTPKIQITNQKQKQNFQVKQNSLKQILQKTKQRLEKIEKAENQLNNKINKPNIKQLSDEIYRNNVSKNWILTKKQIAYVLSKEIKDFVANQEKKCTGYQEMNVEIISVIQNRFNLLFPDLQIKISLYGSQASGLYLSFSDIDLVIASNVSHYQFFKIIEQSNLFSVPQIFKQTKFIKNAMIPIIKLVLGQKYNYRKVDITFQTYFHNGIRCNDLLKQFLKQDPLIKPLVLVLKNFFYSHSLNDTYTGGLGSYSLILMVVAFLQSTTVNKNENDSLGNLLIQFLYFYGYMMDYVCKSILVYFPQFKQTPIYNVFPLPNTQDPTPKLIIHDPLNPVNNVGRSTYKIQYIKNLFLISYNKLFYNYRCTNENCRWKLQMDEIEAKILPCCILKRFFEDSNKILNVQ